jgi:hypothetical protein
MDDLKKITHRYVAALTKSSQKEPDYVKCKLLPQALVEYMTVDEDDELLCGSFVKSVLREELILKASKECGFFWMVQAVWDKAKDGWTGTIDTSIEGYADYPVFDNSALCKFVVRSIPHCLVSTWRILKAEYAEGELFDVDVMVDGSTVLQMAKTTFKAGGERIIANFHEGSISKINMFHGELTNLTTSLQWEKTF